MAKPEIEFIDYDTEYEWRLVEGDTLGIKEKILSLDPETGDYTRMLKFPPGIETSETLVHEFWEEVLLIEGSLTDIAKKETYLPDTMPVVLRECSMDPTKSPTAASHLKSGIIKNRSDSLLCILGDFYPAIDMIFCL